VAETDRKASAELRKKAAPKKKGIVKKSGDLSSLQKAFGIGAGKLSTTLDQYGRYILVEMNPDSSTTTKYIYVDPNGTDWERLNGTEVIKRIKETYKDQDALRKVLYEKGFLSKQEFTTKSVSALNGAILQAATEFSTEVADAYTTEGKIKFPTFSSWISKRGAAVGEEKPDLPVRDIDLMDRDVVEAIVKDVYTRTTDMAIDDEFLKKETDRYMEQIQKGTLSTVTQEGKEVIRKTTKPFSEAQVRAELPGRIEAERPDATKYKKNLDFLAFLDGLGAPIV
jgi:hypothetical protein